MSTVFVIFNRIYTYIQCLFIFIHKKMNNDRFKHRYLLVGCVGDDAEENLKKLDAQQEKQSDLVAQSFM